MSVAKKITFLGAGSLYFKYLLDELSVTEGLEGSEILLYDLDFERASLIADYGKRLLSAAGMQIGSKAVRTLAEAIDGADFALLNVGGAGGGGGGYYGSKVHTKDLLIGAQHGIFQVVGDTVGPAAMMASFRTLPIYLEMCQEMEKRCPHVMVINHANPMAVLCRAMVKYTGLKNIIGICHGVQGGIHYAGRLLEIPPKELETVWVGTNHYYWFTRVFHQGKDLYPELRKRLATSKPDKDKTMAAKLSQIFGYHIVYPQDDHIIEFYPYLAQVRKAGELPYALADSHHGIDGCDLYSKHGLGGKPSGKKQVRLTRTKIITDLKTELKNLAIPDKNTDWTSGEGVMHLVRALATGERRVHIVNIPNQGAVPNLPDEAVLEVEGITNTFGMRPILSDPAPRALMAQLHSILAWQEMVVDAGIKGDKNLALQALMLDPAALLPEKAEKMLGELLKNFKRVPSAVCVM